MPALRIRALAAAIGAASLLGLSTTATCLARERINPQWTATPPAIDGNAGAPAWNAGTALDLDGRDGATHAYLLEDAKYLYVAITAQQRGKIVAKSLADETPLDSEDSVALQFRSGNRQLTFRANAFGAHDALESGDAAFAPDWKSAGRILPGRYEVTMRIARKLFETAGAPLRVSLERHFAGGDRTERSRQVAFDDVAGAYSTVPARIVAGQAGDFADRYRSVWPSQKAPVIPGTAEGVAVKHAAGPVTVAALDAQSGDRDDNAQSIVYTSPDKRLSSTVQRVESTQTGVRDVVQSLSFLYDNQNNLSLSGGVAVDRAVRDASVSDGNYAYTKAQYRSGKSSADLAWSDAGPAYNPQDEFDTSAGTNGYSADASRQIGAFTIQGAANAYRDDIGTLTNSEDRASISVPLGGDWSADVSSAADYSAAIGAYNENGVHLSYSGDPASGSLDFRAGSYEDGFLQDAGLSADFHLPLLGAVSVQHRRRDFWSFDFPQTAQMLNAVRVTHRIASGTFSLSYRNVTGALPAFMSNQDIAGTGVSFAFDRFIGVGLLHFSYNESTAFYAVPSFSLKIIPGARP